MSLETITDWQGAPLEVGLSRGGVPAALDVRRIVLWNGRAWPPAGLKRKLKRSPQARAFDPETRAALEETLGYYCDLQSFRSEDSMTWSFFGPFIESPEPLRCSLLDWLLALTGIDCAPAERCEVVLWRRLAHPDTGIALHGPEPDFALIGDSCLILGEAKWGASEDTRQGVLGDTSQMEMRRTSLASEGKVHGVKVLVALGVARDGGLEPPRPDAASVFTRIVEWADLATYPDHPHEGEFARYLDWRAGHMRAGEAPA